MEVVSKYNAIWTLALLFTVLQMTRDVQNFNIKGTYPQMIYSFINKVNLSGKFVPIYGSPCTCYSSSKLALLSTAEITPRTLRAARVSCQNELSKTYPVEIMKTNDDIKKPIKTYVDGVNIALAIARYTNKQNIQEQFTITITPVIPQKSVMLGDVLSLQTP